MKSEKEIRARLREHRGRARACKQGGDSSGFSASKLLIKEDEWVLNNKSEEGEK